MMYGCSKEKLHVYRFWESRGELNTLWCNFLMPPAIGSFNRNSSLSHDALVVSAQAPVLVRSLCGVKREMGAWKAKLILLRMPCV